MASEKFFISYESKEESDIKAEKTSVIETNKDFLDIALSTIQSTISDLLNLDNNKKIGAKIASEGIKVLFRLPGLAINFSIDLEEQEDKGWIAKISSGVEAIETEVVGVLGASLTNFISRVILRQAAIVLLGSAAAAGSIASAPVAAATLVVGVAGVFIAQSLYEGSYLDRLFDGPRIIGGIKQLITDGSDFIIDGTNNIGNAIKNNVKKLITKDEIKDTITNKSLDINDGYFLVAETEGEQTIPLDENDNAIFLGENPVLEVNYNNTEGDRGLIVDLRYGTSVFDGSENIKDYLGNAVINVYGTKFDDIIVGDLAEEYTPINGGINNKLNGNAGSDSIFGGDGDDTLIGTNEFTVGEVDVLTGGSGADTFVLGNSSEVFYGAASGFPSDIEPQKNGDAVTFLPENVRPKEFAIITDFNAEEGDKLQLKGPATFTKGSQTYNTYRIIPIKNVNVISHISDEKLLEWFMPDRYSAAIVYSSDLNISEEDFREDNVVAVLPDNADSIFDVGSFYNLNFDTQPNPYSDNTSNNGAVIYV